jgi:hypothetical protein
LAGRRYRGFDKRRNKSGSEPVGLERNLKVVELRGCIFLVHFSIADHFNDFRSLGFFAKPVCKQ